MTTRITYGFADLAGNLLAYGTFDDIETARAFAKGLCFRHALSCVEMWRDDGTDTESEVVHAD